MRFSTLALVCCVAPGLTGCIVAKAIGAAVDVTASAATAAVKVAGAAVETTVDVVTPDSEDEADQERDQGGERNESREAGDATPPESASHDGGEDSSRLDRPRP